MIILAQYRTHKTVDQLKQTEKAQTVKHHLKGNVQKVYSYLIKSSFGNLGACMVKAQTIADKLGISRATVTRCLKTLRDLHIIESHESTKMNGIKAANIYSIIFLSHTEPTNEPSKMIQRAIHENTVVSKVSHVKHEHESFNSFNLSFNPFVNSVNTYNAYGYAEFEDIDLKDELRQMYLNQNKFPHELFEELFVAANQRLKQGLQKGVPYEQMKFLTKRCMRQFINKNPNSVDKPVGMYSRMIERQTNQLFEQPQRETFELLASRSKEKVPDWYFKRNEEEQPVQQPQQVDYEAERLKILAKLGQE